MTKNDREKSTEKHTEKPKRKLQISEDALRKIVDEEDALAPTSNIRNVRAPGDPGAPPGAI